MENKVTKFFTSSVVLFIIPCIFFISALLYDSLLTAYKIAPYDLFTYIFDDILIFGVILALVISFAMHEKNVTKCLLGAALMHGVVLGMEYLGTTIKCSVPVAICGIIYFLCYLGMFINHNILCSSHASNKSRIKFNHILGIIAIVSASAQMIFYFQNVLSGFIGILGVINDGLLILTILIVETKVDEFKQERESK